MKKLMMEPGSALLVLAVLAFLARWLVQTLGIPLIGGTLSFILFWLMVFGAIGGAFLMFKTRGRTA